MRANQFPRGFLALIGAQNMGKNVADFAEVVSPVVDVGDNYLAEKLEVSFGGANPANGFVASTLVIPTGEVWKVFLIDAAIVTGGAVTIAAYSPAIRINGVAITLANPAAVPINTTTWLQSLLDPLWLPSGTEFGIYSAGVVGAPVGSVQAVFSRFKA